MKLNISALAIFAILVSTAGGLSAAGVTISIDTPMVPPSWALLERELLKANTAACREFFNKYFDERGYLMCVETLGR